MAAFFLGWIVMLLWNAILVPAAGAGLINYWQALGLFILSRILVGGFGRGAHRNWGGPLGMKDKWRNMSVEDKARFQEEWKRRCVKKSDPSPSSLSPEETKNSF
jgi:hypothetical protein